MLGGLEGTPDIGNDEIQSSFKARESSIYKGIRIGFKGEMFSKIETFSNRLFLKQINFFHSPS